MLKTCPGCGTSAGDRDRFCGRCGTSLAGVTASATTPHAFCTSCGAPLSASDRFCARCGAASGRPEPPGDAIDDPETERFDPEDFFGEWDGEGARPDEARTEQVLLQPARKTDTAVLPVIAPGAPAGERRPTGETRPSGAGFPWGATFAFAGAVAIVAASALPLVSAGRTILPRDVAVSALLFPDGPARGPSLGLVLLGLGVVGALVALLTMVVPRLRLLRRVIGLVTLVVPVLVLVRVVESGSGFLDLPDVLGVSVYLSLGGGITQIVAGRRLRR